MEDGRRSGRQRVDGLRERERPGAGERSESYTRTDTAATTAAAAATTPDDDDSFHPEEFAQVVRSGDRENGEMPFGFGDSSKKRRRQKARSEGEKYARLQDEEDGEQEGEVGSPNGSKRRRSHKWPLTDEQREQQQQQQQQREQHTSPVGSKPKRKTRTAAGSASSRRGIVSPERASRFKEGSMHDRASEKPPSMFTRFMGGSGGGTTNVDQLMEDYHADESERTRQSTKAEQTQSTGLTQHANQNITSALTANAADAERSGIFRFGKSLTSTFNPMTYWKKVQVRWEETRQELIAEERERRQKEWEEYEKKLEEVQRQRKLNEQKSRAETIYAQMKKEGKFTKEAMLAAAAQQQDDSDPPRDSGVSMNEPRSQSYSHTSRPTGQNSAAAKTTLNVQQEPSRLSFLKSSSLSNLKRARSEISLGHNKRGLASTSPEKALPDPPPVSALRRVVSRKDLQRQQKLTKRVSDLEVKLNQARRELYETLGSDCPPAIPELPKERVPEMPKIAKMFNPPSRPVVPPKKLWTPGGLPTVPSERLLFPDQLDERVSEGEDEDPADEEDVPERPRSELNHAPAAPTRPAPAPPTPSSDIWVADVSPAKPVPSSRPHSGRSFEFAEPEDVPLHAEDSAEHENEREEEKGMELDQDQEPPKRKRGRPLKNRPASAASYKPASAGADDDAEWEEAEAATATAAATPQELVKRKRGRPAKGAAAAGKADLGQGQGAAPAPPARSNSNSTKQTPTKGRKTAAVPGSRAPVALTQVRRQSANNHSGSIVGRSAAGRGTTTTAATTAAATENAEDKDTGVGAGELSFASTTTTTTHKIRVRDAPSRPTATATPAHPAGRSWRGARSSPLLGSSPPLAGRAGAGRAGSVGGAEGEAEGGVEDVDVDEDGTEEREREWNRSALFSEEVNAESTPFARPRSRARPRARPSSHPSARPPAAAHPSKGTPVKWGPAASTRGGTRASRDAGRAGANGRVGANGRAGANGRVGAGSGLGSEDDEDELIVVRPGGAVPPLPVRRGGRVVGEGEDEVVRSEGEGGERYEWPDDVF